MNAERGSVPAHHANQDLQNFMYAKKHTDPDLFRWSSRPKEQEAPGAASVEDVNVFSGQGDIGHKEIALRPDRIDGDEDL